MYIKKKESRPQERALDGGADADDGSNCGLNEISYGIKVLWTRSPADVNLQSGKFQTHQTPAQINSKQIHFVLTPPKISAGQVVCLFLLSVPSFSRAHATLTSQDGTEVARLRGRAPHAATPAFVPRTEMSVLSGSIRPSPDNNLLKPSSDRNNSAGTPSPKSLK